MLSVRLVCVCVTFGMTLSDFFCHSASVQNAGLTCLTHWICGTQSQSKRWSTIALACFADVLSGPVLRDTARLSQRYPPIARLGLLVSQHGQLGAIPPPPILRVSPMRSGGAIPPPSKGVSQRYLCDAL